MVTRPSNDQAVTEGLKANLPDLLRYLLRRVQDPEHAADLVSDAGVVIWSKRAKAPHDPEALRMWMFVIARNVLRTHRRSEQRRSTATSALAQEIRLKARLEQTQVDIRLDVRAAVQRLPPRLREPLILVHWDGFSLNEAASHLGVNASTLRSRYAAARAAVAEQLGVTTQEASPPLHI